MPQEKMTMDQVRERFPEYDDMDDMTLANAIHGRFYSDIPLADFYAQVGFNPQQDAGDNGVYPPPPLGSSAENPIDLNARPTADVLRKGAWVVGREGRPYQLTEDARNAPTRLGDVEESPGVYSRPLSVAEDVAKSLPTGVVEGLTGILGMPGTVQQMMGGEAGQMLPGFGFVSPSGEQMNQMIRQGLGRDYYQAQTPVGEFSQTTGEFLPGVVAPGGMGTKLASWLVPAFASESAGQIARGMGASPTAENITRLISGVGGGLGVGGVTAIRGGVDNVLANAAPNVTPQQLQLAAALSASSEVLGNPLTRAEAVQQVTGGATNLGRVQRVIEGTTNRLGPMMAERPNRVDQAIANVLNQIGPEVEPSQLAGQARAAANSVLENTRARINAQAGPSYRAADQQVISAQEYDALRSIPAFREAEAAFYADPVLSQGAAGPQSVSALNDIIQQMDTLAYNADPGNMMPGANLGRANRLSESARMAKSIVDYASPDYAQARLIGATGRQTELVPIQRGPVGSIAAQPELQPNLPAIRSRLFPPSPEEGQAAETARALQLMAGPDPAVVGPLVRQQLAQQAAEATQRNVSGPNPFGGAKFAATQFGNRLQSDTMLGAVDTVAPMASRDIRDLVENLRATGQREPQGSNTSFNNILAAEMQGGNVVQESLASLLNPMRIPGRIAGAVDDLTAQANRNTLADVLMMNSEDFNARLTRALNRPRGANRVRAGVAVTAGQED
jgi:hypothetical protein